MPTEMGAPVLYIRIPPELKRQLGVYKDERAQTLTAAVTELLERGLAAVADEPSVEERETRATRLEEELALTRIELAEANAALTALRGRELELKTLGERAELTVGHCPSCRKAVRGTDVLLTQRCPNPDCGRSFKSLLLPTKAGANSVDRTELLVGLDRTELLVLLGALGIIVGAAYVQSRAGN